MSGKKSPSKKSVRAPKKIARKKSLGKRLIQAAKEGRKQLTNFIAAEFATPELANKKIAEMAKRNKAYKDLCDKLPIDKSMGKVKPSDLAPMTLESAPNYIELPSAPNFDLLAAIKNDKTVPLAADKLDHIRDLAKAMRDIDKQIKDTEELLKERKARLFTLQMEELPDLFAEYKVPSITLEAEGNNSKVTLTAQPFYKAVMPEDSAPGFEWLEAEGHGDLIKRVFTVALPMDSVKLADRFRNGMIKAGIPFEEKKTVPWTTLTAFVKEQIEKHHASLPLEKLGAFVGKIVKIKESKK